MKRRQGPDIPLSRFSEAPAAGADLPLASDAVDARIGALLRRVPEPAPLSEARLARVAARLAPRSRGARGRWRAALVALVVMGISGAVYARHEIRAVVAGVVAYARSAVRPVRRAAETDRVRPAEIAAGGEVSVPPVVAGDTTPAGDRGSPGPVARRREPGKSSPETRRPARDARASGAAGRLALASPARGARLAGGAGRTGAPALTPPAVAPRPLPATPPAPRSAPVVAERPPTRRSDTPALPPPDTVGLPLIGPPPPDAPLGRPAARLGDEAALLREALASLRHDDDPEAALAALDQYDRRFPHGVLRPNADLVRVDTLVALRRGAEALALLDRLHWRTTPRADDLQITRAELRAASDCHAARSEFTTALARNLAAPLAERALRGRATCALRLGDTASAEADLRDYVARFPTTPFATKARAQLGNRGGP